jgi:DNA-binding FadR family transcriptional regulator
MTLKWKDMEKFMEYIWKEHGDIEIGLEKLEMMIRKRFGVSRHVVENVLSALKDCDMIKPSNTTGWYTLIYNRDNDMNENGREIDKINRQFSENNG